MVTWDEPFDVPSGEKILNYELKYWAKEATISNASKITAKENIVTIPGLEDQLEYYIQVYSSSRQILTFRCIQLLQSDPL